MKDSPLSRFLVQKGTLLALERSDELPSPRPVAGLGNRFLAATHLEAALHEGKPDEVGLRWAFGDAAVEELLTARQDLQAEGTRARWDARAHAIVRSRILTRAAEPWPDERRETITQNILGVRSEHDGVLLRRVDRRVALTRFYPHRVFQARGALWQVGATAIPPAADHIPVAPAPAGAALTLPLLRIES